jgi:hypothetical protein
LQPSNLSTSQKSGARSVPTDELAKLRDASNELRYEQWPEVGRRWQESLCVEKQEGDRLQRPANGSVSPTETSGPFACSLPQKELDVLRSSCSDVRYTNKMHIESDWIATVCAEKKVGDALVAQRPVESINTSDERTKCLLNRMEVLDGRIRDLPVESRWTHNYYYSSKILQ